MGRPSEHPVTLVLVAVLAGPVLDISAVVLGETDDSPGLQGPGVLLVLAAVVLGVRAVRRAG